LKLGLALRNHLEKLQTSLGRFTLFADLENVTLLVEVFNCPDAGRGSWSRG
jgi:hypothetical protein